MKKKWIFLCLGILFLFTFCLALSWGSYSVPFSHILEVFVGGGESMERVAILSIRLPRILVAIFVAIGLSTAGAVLQTVTENDLADPGVIGMNAGASLAAVLFVEHQTAAYYSDLGEFSIFLLPAVAVIGAFLSAMVIYFLASRGGFSKTKLLLMGIGVNSGINAFITFRTFRFGNGEYNKVLTWTSGSLWGSGWSYVKILAPVMILLFLGTLTQNRKLDVMTLSDEVGIGLGLPVQKTRKRLLFLAVALAGTATAFAGNIGFLGLLAPHIAKSLVGIRHRWYIPASALISVVILLFADVLSRNLFSPIELPVGIIVSVVGVPYFLYLIWKKKGRE